MRYSEVTTDQAVTVTCGYTTRPAVVTTLFPATKRVGVRYTDVPAGLVLPVGHAHNVYGAVVRPGQISAAKA